MAATRSLLTTGLIRPVFVRHRSLNSNDWLERRSKDRYIELAKRECYRCRSAFKLIEIDDKYKILKPGQCVVDLGAAPGSWTQVMVQRTNADGKDVNKKKGTVISIDRTPISPIVGATILKAMDITQKSSQEIIQQSLENKKFNFVFSDMAPNATGVKSLDAENIFNLACLAIQFSLRHLQQQGGVLFKMWDSGYVPTISQELHNFFNNVNLVRPKATQSESSEIFILARSFKGLKTNS